MSESSPPERADPDDQSQPYVLNLYVTGASVHSARAITHIKRICEAYLPGNYSLEIIDVHQQKEHAQREQLIALPLLIKRSPLPARRLVGDLSDTEKVLRGLDIKIL